MNDRPTQCFERKKKKDLPTDQHKKFWVGKQQTNNFLRLAQTDGVKVHNCSILLNIF